MKNDKPINGNLLEEKINPLFNQLCELLKSTSFTDLKTMYQNEASNYVKESTKQNRKSKALDLNKYMQCKEIVDAKVGKKEFNQFKRDLYDIGWLRYNINDILDFYNAGDRLYTLSVYDTISNVVRILKEKPYSLFIDNPNCKTPLPSWNDEEILDLYKKVVVLGESLYRHNFIPDVNTYTNTTINNKRQHIKRDYLHKLDGMEVLISHFSDEKEFIKMAVEGSYFFEPELVVKAMNELSGSFYHSKNKGEELIKDEGNWVKSLNNEANKIGNEEIKKIFLQILSEDKNIALNVNKFINYLNKRRIETKLGKKLTKPEIDCLNSIKSIKDKLTKDLNYLEARYTTDEKIIENNSSVTKCDKAIYTIEGKQYRVDIDKDGNDSVRSLITNKTGITISQGKESLFQNTIISHVWGRAYDPRFFTSLWNIVLIPAWANSLMDKEDAPANTLASKMQNTYMAICSLLYREKLKDIIWENLDMDGFPKVKVKEDIILQDYTFNIIKEKEGTPKNVTIVIDKRIEKQEKLNQLKDEKYETPPRSPLAPVVNSPDM